MKLNIQRNNSSSRSYINICIMLLCGVFIFASCQKKQINVVEIEFDLDRKNGPTPVIKIDRIIPLELTKNSTLPGIYEIKVEYFDNKFYVLDIFGGRCMYVFNNKGLLVNKTKVGRGPGELTNPYAFDIDEKNKVIQVHDQTLSTITKLDPELNFISSSKYDSIRIIDFRILSDDKILVSHHMRADNTIAMNSLKEYYQFTLYEENYTKATRLKPTIFARNPKILATPFSVSDETLLIVPRNYTVYRLTDSKTEPAYQLNFGKYMYSKGELKRLSDKEKEEMEMIGKKTAGMGTIQKSGDFLMTIILHKTQPVTLFHSFKTEICYNLIDCFEESLLPSCYTQGSIGEDKYLALVEPGALEVFIKATNSYPDLIVSENDNPYLIIYSISEKEQYRNLYMD
jgi:hypothetical protein